MVAATPLVPPSIQHVIERRTGALAYVPTRAGFGYRYLSYTWNASTKTLSVRVHDKHYATTNARHTMTFTARWFGGTLASCPNGMEKTIQYDGNRVYTAGAQAWRCVVGAGGRIVKLAATSPTLPGVALAQIVSSGKRLP